jgi:hypothetical protein
MFEPTPRRLLLFAAVLWICSAGASFVIPLGAEQPLQLGAGASADDAVRGGLLAGDRIPRSIHDIRARLLAEAGGVLRTHVVANGGHAHPTRRGVMFMAFESYEGPLSGGRVEPGELLLGFFLSPEQNTLTISDGFVELIAWDRKKQAFNFWELIGPRWSYRGDSRDVLANVAALNLGDDDARFTFTSESPDGEPVLRCSGCHTLGAPIMKELDAPHNDWWRTARPFPLGSFVPDAAVAKLLADATDASNLATEVKRGIDRLIAAGHTREETLPRRLRSLFATMEVNLVSDQVPYEDRLEQSTPLQLPASFFVDTRLAPDAAAISVGAKAYQTALARLDSRFPADGPGRDRESHHAFVVPARSYVDNRMIDALIAEAVLDDELVADVLAVDMTTPVYSRERARLIRFVPERAGTVQELRSGLIDALQKAPASDLVARELLANLTDPARTASAHRQSAQRYLATCAQAAATPAALEGWLRYADRQRGAIEDADTAKHPSGLITEKGFREIFPGLHAPVAPATRLSPATCLVDPAP